jgi:hypothetical protein
MEVDSHLHASAALLHGKEPSLLTEKEDWRSLEPIWSLGEEKCLLPMIGLELQSVGIAACSSVTGPTERSKLYCQKDGCLCYLLVEENFLASDANQLHLFL